MSQHPIHDALHRLDLDGIQRDAWQRLVRGAADRRSPLHTPVLSTLDASGRPSARTIVLRAADPKQHTLIGHSDTRAAKMHGLQQQPWAEWVFWDPRARIQLRARGTITVHHGDDVAQEHWRRIGLYSQRGYTAATPPGTPTASPTSGLDPDLLDTVPTQSAVQHGFAHFSVLICTVSELEWLLLARTGHRRARLCPSGHTWLVP